MTLHRWKLIIEYDGRPFCGWQRQEPGIPSVQESIEVALRGFTQQDLTIHVAGRTDAGVHAWGQVVHVDLDLPDRYEGFMVAKAINAHLRDDPVVVLMAERVSNDFHARFSAINKLYTYRIVCRTAPLAIERGRAWVLHHEMDIEGMRQASRHLLGHHDFSTFRDSDCQAKSPVRTLDRLDIETRAYDGAGAQEILFQTEARSFLHHQVRNMVGTLAQVGLERIAPDDVALALAACDRKAGGPTAPAEGLYLVRVDYPV